MKTTKTSILVAREGSSKANQGETARINGSWQTRTEMGGNRSRRCSAAVMWRHSRSGSKRNRRPEAPVSHHHVDHIGSGRSRCLMGQAATKHSTEKVSRTSVLHNLNVPACLRSPLLPSPCFLSPRPSIVRFHWDLNTMSAPSLAPYIIKRPWLQRFLMPLAKWYTDAAGYRRLGLK